MAMYLTPDEVAERLQRSPQLIRRWIREGRLRAEKVGRSWAVTTVANGPTDVVLELVQLNVYRAGTNPLPRARLMAITAGESRKLAAGETATIPFSFVQNLESGRYSVAIQENSRATADNQGAVGGAVSAVEFTVR